MQAALSAFLHLSKEQILYKKEGIPHFRGNRIQSRLVIVAAQSVFMRKVPRPIYLKLIPHD